MMLTFVFLTFQTFERL